MRHFQREYHEAVALLSWWAIKSNSIGLDQRLFVHVGNETGGMGARRGWFNKQIGTRKGFPDYTLFLARGGYNALVLELKHENGKVSPAQKEMMALLSVHGYLCYVAFGWQSAANAIDNYLRFGRIEKP